MPSKGEGGLPAKCYHSKHRQSTQHNATHKQTKVEYNLAFNPFMSWYCGM